MTQNAPPSGNTANSDSLAGLIQFAFTKLLQQTDNQLPAQVLSYDEASNRAKVQILIPYVTTSKERVLRAAVASVPVTMPGGGNYTINFPILPGELGWIKANDRDISSFKATLAMSTPNTQRKHTFEDACFTPDKMRKGVVIAAEDSSNNNLTIQSLDGTVKISFWSTFIKLISRFGIGANPGTGVIFGVYTTTKASIPHPRMTQTQRDALTNLEEGMTIWNLTTHGVNVYNGTIWG